MKNQPQPVLNPEEAIKIIHSGMKTCRSSWNANKIDTDNRLVCSSCKTPVYGKKIEGSIYQQCQICSSILGWCPICKAGSSFSEKFNIIVCNGCKQSFIMQSEIDNLLLKEKTTMDTVLSGIRPTGKLHLGNFFGAIKQFVKKEKEENLCLFFIADWHSLTTSKDPRGTIPQYTMAVARAYIAAGLDPNRSLIYTQSSIPEIAELTVYLSMIQSKKQLEHLPTLKDLVKGKEEGMTLGHLSYPVMMAADILAPKATLIPVGSDQDSNVEIARSIAESFNNRFGHTFPIPRGQSNPMRVPSLSGGKMGKSEEDLSITLLDTEEVILNKYKKFGVTDIQKFKKGDKGDVEKCESVYPMHKFLHTASGRTDLLSIIEKECSQGERGCFDCKVELARNIASELLEFQSKWKDLEGKEKYIRDILHYGGMKMREIVTPTLEEVRDKIGIVIQ